MPLCSPQTPHAARTRTRAASVGSQRLTAELRHGQAYSEVTAIDNAAVPSNYNFQKGNRIQVPWNMIQ
jgi:hypothetical protein